MIGAVPLDGADAPERLQPSDMRLDVRGGLGRTEAAGRLEVCLMLTRPINPVVGLGPGGDGAVGRAGARRSADLDQRADRRRLAAETLMANDIYVSLVYRPAAGVAAGLISKWISKAHREALRLEILDALDACAKLRQILLASLAPYDPEPLGTYGAGGVHCSSLLEFLGVLVNGEWQRMTLPYGPLNEALASTRLLFGTEAIEYRMPAATRFGAMLGIK